MSKRLLAVASALVICVGGAISAHAASLPVAVIAARSIDSNETYSGMKVLLAGTVTVNGTLDLEGDQIIALPGTDVVVNGTLEIGSSRWSGSDSTMRAPGVLRASDFDADKLSVTITGSAQLTRTTLSNSQSDLIDVFSGSLQANSLTLDTASQVGLRAIDATVSIDTATISGTNGYALSTERGSFDATGLNVASSNDYGLWAHGGSVRISSSAFGGDCGVYLGPDTSGSVDGVGFATHNHGLTQYQTGSVTLEHLSFSAGAAGLTVIGSTVSARAIDAAGVATGIVVANSSGTIDGGTISGGTGVQVLGSSGLAPTLRNLDLSSVSLGVDNTTSTSVDARWNYWGAAPSVHGPVLVSPWLAAAP